MEDAFCDPTVIGEQNWVHLNETDLDGGQSCCNVTECSDFNCIETAPYTFDQSRDLGRFIVAKRDITPGEIIIRDKPLVIGPSTALDYSCIGCYTPLSPQHQYKCPSCNWTICCSECKGLYKWHGHTERECILLAKHKTARIFENLKCEERRYMYEVLLHIRCLLLRDTDIVKWNKLWSLEAHNETRKRICTLWNRNQTIIVDRIRKDFNMTQFSEDEIHTICGFIEVNCFQIGINKQLGRAIYYKISVLVHDCCPNSSHLVYTSEYNKMVRATRIIAKGEKISINYAYCLRSTLARRDHLEYSKFFWCECQRCSDPTEFGTYCSCFICPACDDGIVMSENPLCQKANWKCNQCSFHMNFKLVRMIYKKLDEEFFSIPIDDVLGIENYISKYRGVLHKNNYLNLTAKYNLVQRSGLMNDLEYSSMSPEFLKRKERYCMDLIEMFDLLDPGLTRMRAFTMYELHQTKLIRLLRKYEMKKIDRKNYKNQFNYIKYLLKTVVKVLKYDQKDTIEYDMVKKAKQTLKQIKQIIPELTNNKNC